MAASTLILPIENQVRELDAKLLLACAAAERGFPVLLGSRAYAHFALASVPRGVYLAKSMRSLSERVFEIARMLGHEIVAWDEEALVHLPERFYHERRLSAASLAHVAMLFAWGPDNRELFEHFPAASGIPVHTVGNPRLDLTRRQLQPYFDDEVRRIRARYGRFVLVNTNFGAINHFVPSLSDPGSSLFEAARCLDEEPEPANEAEFNAARAVHRRRILAAFEQMLPELRDALPGCDIVLRPHPSESHESWRELAERVPRLHVVNEGNVLPWLRAARAVVHNGCTTGIEASLLGVPAVAYQPSVSQRYDDHLPNAVSHRARDVKELGNLLSAILEGELGPCESPERDAALGRFLSGVDGPLASDRMVDALADAGYLQAQPPRPPLARRALGQLHCRARSWVKHANRHRPGHRGHASYHDHRFPGLRLEDLRGRVERLGALLGRFRGVRVSAAGTHLFRVEAPTA